MPAPERTQAIVVGSVDYAEADRIVRLLSPSHGRLSVLARGARRSKRRFAGALEPGNRIAAVLRPGRGELWHLDGATLLDGRLHARDHLERIALLLYACELCGGLSREQHPEARLYGLLDMALTLIDGVNEPPSALFRMALEAKALTFAGLLPALDRCAACGEPLGEGPLLFDPAIGGVAHAACHAGGEPLPAGWAPAVEAARRLPLLQLVDAPPPDGPVWALSDHIGWQLGRPLRSRAVLASLDSPAGPPPGR